MHLKRFTKSLVSVAAACLCLCAGCFQTVQASAVLQYQCDSYIGSWLRSEPMVSDDNMICVVNSGEVVDVISTDNGWGQVYYADDYGNVYTGYTYLGNYSPVGTYQQTVENYVESNFSQGTRDVIFNYLCYELGFNRAAATAVLTNMDFESGCNPSASCMDVNDLPSYGLCQWNGPRCEALLRFCNNQAMDVSNVYSQLAFLKYELQNIYTNQYEYMLSVDDTQEAAYHASYFWASRFEVCSSDYWEARGWAAYNAYY